MGVKDLAVKNLLLNHLLKEVLLNLLQRNLLIEVPLKELKKAHQKDQKEVLLKVLKEVNLEVKVLLQDLNPANLEVNLLQKERNLEKDHLLKKLLHLNPQLKLKSLQ